MFQPNKFIGTGLVCLGLLAYEIFTARLLSVVLEEHLIIFAIALAMLGMGAATSLSSLGKVEAKYQISPDRLAGLASALGVSYLLCLAWLTLLNENSNSLIESAIDRGALPGLIESIRTTMLSKMLWVGAALFAPYFIFGLFIARLFRSAVAIEYHKLYAADLVGAALGCIFAVIALDYAGYVGCLTLISLSTFGGAIAFLGGRPTLALALNLALLIVAFIITLSPSLFRQFEPQPALDQLARNYDNANEVVEEWRVWNAHSRVALLSLRNKLSGRTQRVYAHENGSGWAHVPDETLNGWNRLATMFGPKKVLVLFAGVGDDMVQIDKLCDGKCEITGVEINRHMVDHVLSNGPSALTAFLSRPGINLVVAEAREYLERDTRRYDTILLSWWGAGTSHYIGTSGKLAQYLYTQEAYETLLDHLNPNGTIILFNSSKAQSLVNFRRVFEKRGLGNFAQSAVIVRQQSDVSKSSPSSKYYDTLEQMRLVIKPSGFSVPDMATVHGIVEELGARLILSSESADPDFATYGEIANGANLEAINEELIANNGVELSIVTDDRPFINELVPRSYYVSLSKWLDSNDPSGLWKSTRVFLAFVLNLGVLALIFIMGPLLVKSGPRLSRRNIIEMVYFLSLGSGFILVEIGLVRKLGLLLGHPSYSISIVLASLILSTGLGSLCSNALFQSGILSARRAALLVVLYAIGSIVIYESSVKIVITLPLLAKCAISVLALFPLGFLMGQLFPQGLVRVGQDDNRLIPWAWAINSTSSTIFVGVAYLLSYPLGFNSLILLGAVFYAVIVFLPLASVSRRDEQAAALA